MAVAPKVSIVVDNHNYARYLRAAIDSALAQRWPGVEVVVVDDGSTDGSLEIIRSYGRDVVAVAKEQGGQTSALNAGFSASTGDIVCFLDADDRLYPTAAEAAARLLADPGTARGVWSLEAVDETGRVLSVIPQGAVATDDPAVVLRDGDPHQFAIAPTSSNAWTRDFLETMFPLPEIEPQVGYGSAMADSLLAMASLAFGPARSTPEVHGRYLVHGGNDLARRDLYGRMAMHLAILPRHFERVESYARSRGFDADAGRWKQRSFWFRIERAVAALRGCAPDRGFIALADEGWGLAAGAPFPARPFLERGGRWWGAPATGDEAVEGVERARREGARALAFLWPSFWWLDHFTELAVHLRTTARLVVQSEDVVVFDLA